MARIHWLLISSLIIASSIGCATAPPASPSAEWVSRHGGRVEGAAEQRVLRARQLLLDPALRERLTVAVLASDVPAAYGWPDGQLFVTSGLVEMLSGDAGADDELAAAIAHEAGHLLSDGHMESVAGLRGGCRPGIDAEAEADAAGAGLLRAAGIDPRAMGRMLTKLERSPALSEACRASLRERVARLDSSISSSTGRPGSGPGRCPP